jgi:transcriptional regulator with XRE-family HTH domain
MERDLRLDPHFDPRFDWQFDWQEIVDEAHRRRKERKLPMRRLAAQANVSLPTVLRFEKNERDIQLSSVLAILNVLGMVAKRVEGALLIKGPPEGPYEVRFAPNAGAGGELETRPAANRAALEEILAAVEAGEPAVKSIFAGLERTGAASIAGLQLSKRRIFRFWPEQFSRSDGE